MPISFNNTFNFNIDANILINSENELFKIFPNEILSSEIKFNYIKGYNNEITVVTDDSNRPYLIKKQKIEKELFYKFEVSAYFSNYLIFYKDEIKRIYGIFNIEKSKINFENTEWIGDDIINKSIYTKFDSLISRNIENGYKNWSFDLSTLPKWQKYANEIVDTEVEQIIGEFNGKLWVQLNGYRLLVLDVNSGEKVHYLSEDELQVWGKLYLNQEKGILQSLSGHVYTEINLDKLIKTKSIKIDEKFIAQNSAYYYRDKFIYFSGYYDNVRNPKCYGIFDTDSCEIVWYKVSKDYHFFNPPQASDEYFAILGSKPNHSANDLFVYTRKEIEDEIRNQELKKLS